MDRRTARCRIGLVWLSLPVCLALASSLEAATGSTSVSTSKAGLTLAVNTEWVDCGGYRPVRITVTLPKAAAGDRSFHVEFHGKTYYEQRETSASRDFDLPAGGLSVTAILLVPQSFPWQFYDIHVWEDGKYIKSLSQENIGAGGNGQDWSEALPNILLIADKIPGAAAPVIAPAVGMPAMYYSSTPVPDSSSLAALLPVPDAASSGRFARPVTPGQAAPAEQLDTLLSLPVDQLPQSWLEYSSLDIICISLDQARLLAARDVERWQAIRAWTVAGGNLLVSGLAGDTEKLAEIERLLGEPPARWQVKDPAARGWKRPPDELFTSKLAPPFGKTRINQYGAPIAVPAAGTPPAGPAPANAAPANAATPAAPVYDPPFYYRKHGLGMLVAASADDLMAQPPEQWAGALNALSPDRWLWYRRHGVSPQRPNRDFWNLPIPGVGLAPVTAFQILITGFVLAIGPLNYWWLRRRGKLHLLVMVVPLSAALVTLALFGYALAVDGMGVRVRARTLTEIDQRRGEAACWSRISYYAGLAPSGGLKFGGDTMVIPLDSQADNESRAIGARRSAIWSAEGQDLTNGWLPSRTPAQLVTVRSRASSAAVQFIPAKGGGAPSIANRLGAPIKRLVLADADGAYFSAAEIADDAIARLAPAELAKEGAAFREFWQQSAPGVPLGMDQQSNNFVGGRRFRWPSPWNNSLPDATLASGLLERGLTGALNQVFPSFGAAPAGLVPRSYLAIVERSPDADYGVASVEEEASLHVVAGRW
ncbi:MAG TPA: hypothetical protein VN699_13130 [Pirellulales bacterium]|nr:hypothetical protein [Pirellulales bacterium]